jgi:mannose-6-phosphate isomerase-like protein (cupin superfamily)
MNEVERAWGKYHILYDINSCKIKELVIEPGSSTSMQKHTSRSEYWLVIKGNCIINSMMDNGYSLPPIELETHKSFTISANTWHQLTNITDEPCHIIEIQYGKNCDENDIERHNA